MAERDIIELLKAKEDEMDALLQDARERAKGIIEDAVLLARKIKEEKLKEIEEEVNVITKKEEEAIAREILKIEEDSRIELTQLRETAGIRTEKAIEDVLRFLTRGSIDSRDE